MFTLQGTFAECCAYLQGLDSGVDGYMLTGFADWLRARYSLRPELAWPGLVLEIATGSASLAQLSTDSGARARQLLFELLDAYLEETGARHFEPG